MGRSHGDRIAILGDVHGNIAAFDAVLAGVADAGIDRGLLTGDLVLRGLDPEACVRRAMELGWPCVGGNTDRRVANKALKPDTDVRGMRPGSRTWTRAQLSDQAVAWLEHLPAVAETALGPHRIVAIHGDRTVPPGRIDKNGADHDLIATLDALGADALVVGHTHEPMIRRVGGRLIINPGSVGEGSPDDHRPSWAWITVGPHGLDATVERVNAPLAPPRPDHNGA